MSFYQDAEGKWHLHVPMPPLLTIRHEPSELTPPPDLSNHEDVVALLDHDFAGLQVAHAGLVGTIQRYTELGDFRQHHWQAILQAVEAAIMELQCDECQTKTSRMGLYPIGRGQYACQMHYDILQEKGLL